MLARNAYALPAKSRVNAGAMTHTRPVRVGVAMVGFCACCRKPLDEGDEAKFCADCEPEPVEDWEIAEAEGEAVCVNCHSVEDRWEGATYVKDNGKTYCPYCLIAILRVRLMDAERRAEVR